MDAGAAGGVLRERSEEAPALKTFVCIKSVPNLAEAEVRISGGGTAIDLGGVPLEINDADSCAVEQAILLKEAFGGSVCTVTIGASDQDVMIRMALARGCDRSLRVEYPELKPGTSALVIARILAAAIRGHEFDLILTGAMASDDGHMAVGVALARELGVAHAAVARKVAVASGKVTVVRELEGGLGEVVELALPAVLTLQTGINKPRYAQILGIRAAQKKELQVQSVADVGPGDESLAELGDAIRLERFYRPEVASKAEFMQGDLDTQTEALASRIVRAGGF